MNANEIAFGVELETTMPDSDATPIGGYHRGLPVAWLLPFDGGSWKAERDGSIHPQHDGRHGCEFVSPILKGAEGMANLRTAIEAINDHGGKVNHTCGMHVTVSWNGDARALARLLTLTANHEKALYASTGTRRREAGPYTKPVKPYGDATRAKARCDNDRYHAINLTHLAMGRNRIEFRVFAGTLNPTKAAAYVQMVLGIVSLALSMRRLPTWCYTKESGTESAWDRLSAGDGETEVNRLFYRLGWTKGHSKVCYGNVSGDASIAASKEIIRKMARKYDAAS